MSNDDKEMSDDELNALLNDLETRAEQEGGASADESMDEEDIEAFLADLEEDEARSSSDSGGAKPTASADIEDQGPDLSDLNMDDQVPAETSKDKSTSKKASKAKGKGKNEKKAASEGTEETSGSSSKGWTWALTAGLWLLYALPVVAFGWLLGAYLGQWVSAGWLIFVMSSVITAGIPFGLYRAAGSRGKFRWWLSGASLVLTVALTAPMADSAGEALIEHGHWPATTVSEISGGGLDGFISVGETASGWVGSLLAPEAATTAAALGEEGAQAETTGSSESTSSNE
jgi:hypothetical protein